jgi:hypothetical protein
MGSDGCSVCRQAAAFLPAARRGIGLGLRRGQAPTLLLFMAQLLQVRPCGLKDDFHRT